MPIWSKIYLQDRNSPLIEHLLFFHDHRILVILLIITIIIIIIIISTTNHFNRFILESHKIEIFWTSAPAFILIFIAIPSLKTLYLIEENIKTLLTIKTTGIQWYWNYDYSNNINKKINSSFFNSIKIRTETTRNNLIIPTVAPARILITSKDVLHSWTIPSLGIKSDATPGRINQIILLIKRPGIIVGQCSEICGAGHRFIPIILEAPHIKNFLLLRSFLCSLIKAMTS